MAVTHILVSSGHPLRKVPGNTFAQCCTCDIQMFLEMNLVRGPQSPRLIFTTWYVQVPCLPDKQANPKVQEHLSETQLPSSRCYVGDVRWWPALKLTKLVTVVLNLHDSKLLDQLRSMEPSKALRVPEFFLGGGEVWSKRPKVGFLSQGRLLGQVPMCLAPPRHVLVNGCMCRRLSLSKPQVGDLVLTSCETGVAVGQVSDCHYATTTAGCPVWALSCWLLSSKISQQKPAVAVLAPACVCPWPIVVLTFNHQPIGGGRDLLFMQYHTTFTVYLSKYQEFPGELGVEVWQKKPYKQGKKPVRCANQSFCVEPFRLVVVFGWYLVQYLVVMCCDVMWHNVR